MTRRSLRSVGIVIGMVLLVSLAGCSALGGSGGGDGGGCGPGDSSIEDLGSAGGNATIQGEVTSITDENFVVDDTTGTAWVTGRSVDVSEGDCVVVQGTVATAPMGTDVDASIVPTSIEDA